MTVSAPVTSVATTTLPSLSTPSESNSCISGKPHNNDPVAPASFLATSPGAVMSQA
jgi:hypothetical protein